MAWGILHSNEVSGGSSVRRHAGDPVQAWPNENEAPDGKDRVLHGKVGGDERGTTEGAVHSAQRPRPARPGWSRGTGTAR